MLQIGMGEQIDEKCVRGSNFLDGDFCDKLSSLLEVAVTCVIDAGIASSNLDDLGNKNKKHSI